MALNESSDRAVTTGNIILVIGNVHDWVRAGRTLPVDPEIRYMDFGEMDATLLAEFSPTIVLSPLVAIGFDALDVAAKLQAFGYGGRLRVLSPKLPRPHIIQSELRALAPNVDCDLFQVTNPVKLKVV